MDKVKSTTQELLAKLKIATIALTRIEKLKGTVGTIGTVEEAAELASRAKFNIKHYRTFAKSHDVEED